MKVTFLGTRSNTETRTQRHQMHSSLLVSFYNNSLMVDCGEDWLGNLEDLSMQAIVITHVHPDHAFGLQEGAPCPVYATSESWEEMDSYPIKDRRVIDLRHSR
jgi:ribonuclease BN (tRNA processing enzyme)